jgi:ABC-type sugar transport system permease subunit
VVGGFVTTYDLVYVMTGGGPFHSTEVALTWIVSTTLKFLSVGEGSAMSVVLLAIVGSIGLAQVLLMTRGNPLDDEVEG